MMVRTSFAVDIPKMGRMTLHAQKLEKKTSQSSQLYVTIFDGNHQKNAFDGMWSTNT